jgi:hypothetical protein
MGVEARVLRRDPSRGAVAGGRLAVERRRDLPDHEGRPGGDVALERRVQPVFLVGQDTHAHVHPGVTQSRDPGPVDDRIRIGRSDHHAGDPRHPAARPCTAASHPGGCRARGCRRRSPRGCALPPRGARGPRRAASPRGPSYQPRPTTSSPASTSAPTIGFGATWPQPRSASASASRIRVTSVSCPSIIPRSGAWTRHADRRRGRGDAACPFPLIPTLTVGPGIAPGPPVAGWDGVADCHRRWGFPPRPGNRLVRV